MLDTVENIFPFTMDLKDDEGNIWGTVSVIPSKESYKRDILLMDVHEGNFSVRSITELLNMLEKRNVSLEEKKKVLDFLAERLLFLEQVLP
jgi:hypothetical protein